MQLLLWAIPVFMVTMALEWLLVRERDVRGYVVKDSAASITMGLGNLAVMFFAKMVTVAILFALYQYRLFDVSALGAWVWPVLLVSDDFCSYWYHRAGHEVRFFWAAHVNHHSSTYYNLSTALRQSWTGPLVGWVFWLPLPLLGFHPLMIVTAQAVSLLYQYWIHTELIDRMGVFGWVFNTPSHHRVHHGSDPLYLDRNHGGILIIWDRLFGTFQAESHRPSYGLTTNIETFNPVTIAFHEWQALVRDVQGARTWRGRLGYLLAPPGWREDGSGKTARQLRRQAQVERAACSVSSDSGALGSVS